MKRDMSGVGIAIAKRGFHLVGMDERGKIVLRKRCSRGEVLPWLANLGPTTIGRAACGGAHDWARGLREQGHAVKLMAPQFVKPYVKSNKNDMRDAEAIAEAGTRPSMRCVPVKDVAPHDIQALHRVRERLVTARTALVNEMRGLLAEYGMVLPRGVAQFRQERMSTLEAEHTTLTPLGQELFHQLFAELGT
jgi:transposase